MRKLIWCTLIVASVMIAGVEAMADTGSDSATRQAIDVNIAEKSVSWDNVTSN